MLVQTAKQFPTDCVCVCEVTCIHKYTCTGKTNGLNVTKRATFLSQCTKAPKSWTLCFYQRSLKMSSEMCSRSLFMCWRWCNLSWHALMSHKAAQCFPHHPNQQESLIASRWSSSGILQRRQNLSRKCFECSAIIALCNALAYICWLSCVSLSAFG